MSYDETQQSVDLFFVENHRLVVSLAHLSSFALFAGAAIIPPNATPNHVYLPWIRSVGN
ncbi:hypothetical protein BH10CHL1_BH10CHL1_12720 [soil metagenome]